MQQIYMKIKKIFYSMDLCIVLGVYIYGLQGGGFQFYVKVAHLY